MFVGLDFSAVLHDEVAVARIAERSDDCPERFVVAEANPFDQKVGTRALVVVGISHGEHEGGNFAVTLYCWVLLVLEDGPDRDLDRVLMVCVARGGLANFSPGNFQSNPVFFFAFFHMNEVLSWV